MRPVDQLDDLAFFSVVASSPSLTAAARTLGSSLSAVSRRLSSLEKRLGAQLVRRTTRRADLTPEGVLYAEEARMILEKVNQLEESVAGRSGELAGNLYVRSTQGFGRHHVSPVVAAFSELHPKLSIQLDLSMSPFTFANERFDVDIRLGEPPDSRLVVRRLFTNHRVVCAAPSYAQSRGLPRTPAELKEHECIILRDNGLDHSRWVFFDGSREVSVHVDGDLSSNDAEVVTRWCLEGRGLMLRSTWNVHTFLESGDLLRALEEYTPERADPYIAYESAPYVPERVRRFVDYAAHEIRRRLEEHWGPASVL